LKPTPIRHTSVASEQTEGGESAQTKSDLMMHALIDRLSKSHSNA